MSYIWTFFVVFLAYIVFEFIVKVVDQNRKFELYEISLKNELNGLKKENEDLRKDIDFLLKRQRTFHEDVEKIKGEANRRESEIDDIVSFYKDNINDLIRQGKTVNRENENLQKEVNRLQLQQEIAKLKIDTLTDKSKANEDIFEEFKSGFKFFNEVLKTSLKEIESLVNQVTIMDDELGRLGEDIKSISAELYILQKEMGHIRHNAHQNDKKRYSGGRVILNAIRSGVNFIVNKLVDYIIGGISSVFILS
uniref:Uncharacterized protein LOC111138354 n=1 Tax=Crassostrea virginica TaxID=6565 RepID=A0A8B8F160_CRAVI|nr:uncharacterized protein LOC111138354 [Crassostrea virginica]